MKATGIVRRIDDLGRVVVPKEIRRTLRLREGTPLEIFTDREGEIILKKYSPMMELNAFAGQYADAMAQSTGLMVCITDRDQVVAAAGGAKKDFFQKPISRALEHVIQERMTVQAGKDERAFTPVTDDDSEGITAQVITPIICEGDAIGSVIGTTMVSPLLGTVSGVISTSSAVSASKPIQARTGEAHSSIQAGRKKSILFIADVYPRKAHLGNCRTGPSCRG